MYSVPKEVYISDHHIPVGGYMHVINVNCGILHGLSPTLSPISYEINLRHLDSSILIRGKKLKAICEKKW